MVPTSWTRAGMQVKKYSVVVSKPLYYNLSLLDIPLRRLLHAECFGGIDPTKTKQETTANIVVVTGAVDCSYGTGYCSRFLQSTRMRLGVSSGS
mmetsp:Transcript_13652/g.31523  ORF Transcript_13652/g.31523 Transcript_13652/m.31523 type:complete len:94 (-) Transcript_13652:981-1262(-)